MLENLEGRWDLEYSKPGLHFWGHRLLDLEAGLDRAGISPKEEVGPISGARGVLSSWPLIMCLVPGNIRSPASVWNEQTKAVLEKSLNTQESK